MDVFQKFSKIQCLIFDVDGVFTDCGLLVTEKGELLRFMSARDGQGVMMAVEAGYSMAIITGGDSIGVLKRMQKLGIDDVFLSSKDKLKTYEEYILKSNIHPETVLYVGDDLPDIPLMKKVFLSCCPSDATSQTLAVADYVSPYEGGRGCVRDIIEKVLMAQDKFMFGD